MNNKYLYIIKDLTGAYLSEQFISPNGIQSFIFSKTSSEIEIFYDKDIMYNCLKTIREQGYKVIFEEYLSK